MPRDLVVLAWGALAGHRLRSVLSMLGIAVGVGAVVVLTSVGQGTRDHVMGQLTQFGTNVLIVSPGKSKTLGFPGVLGGTTHPLTIEDAVALERLPEVEAAVPVVIGQARVEGGGRGRSVIVYGVTPRLTRVWDVAVRQGSFWPQADPTRGGSWVVLGPTLKRELFGDASALGELVRIAGRRFRVVGVMEPNGRLLGLDLGDTAFLPAKSAQQVFDLRDVTEIDLVYPPQLSAARVEDAVRRLLVFRHRGNEDFTILTQEAMLVVFANVMNVVTLAVGGIGGVSLLVGAVGILTMMWIAVGERTSEIGLVRAVGATRGQVQALFLVEAAVLATAGGLVGVAGGLFATGLARAVVPGLPLATPLRYVVAALVTAAVTGLLSGVLPARRAARLDPIAALRAE